ncbi:cytochrome oxidase biogenesis protein 1-1 (OXA1), putative [Babesia bigemina]|uniref:Cytochrome oxidase biogenesis protein 1-1 (OXA1), putative n=1 Tax=Babesia bigemina TaxID=5866 RepID=A0A061DAQ8_BABBI|nr:cytochrome oxidase biogenesis protein 1-1 (OXA1), putative [Babesia bigemina]CDR95999.1 cytochrome oxidase biogenesis protein 1-1 (OXA1), putative [Babesia bigemina]|eukprot:XP_012768185.1 cytochrome oxidase biogenesis protein 1-1 (OXA1), putative [Babesia bigemina]
MYTLELFRAISARTSNLRDVQRRFASTLCRERRIAADYAWPRRRFDARLMSTSKNTHSDNDITAEQLPNSRTESAISSDGGDPVGADCGNDDIFDLVEQHNGTSKGLIQRILPVEWMRDMVVAMHDATGLSWAATITSLTVLFKVGFVPLWAMGERARRKNAHLMPIAAELQEQIRHAQKTGNVKLAMEVQRKLYKQMTRKTFLKGAALQVLAAGTQGLTFAWVYGGLKMFAIEPRHCTGFVLEHPFWLNSLALPDPYYVFPVALWFLMTLVYELNRKTAERMRMSAGAVSEAVREQEQRQTKLKYFTRIAIGVFAYFSCSMTSGTFFYLIPSFLFQTVLRYLSQSVFVAKALRLPIPAPPPVQKPETKQLLRVKGFSR